MRGQCAIPISVAACLTGQRVRFSLSLISIRFIVRSLRWKFQLVTSCR